MSAMPVTVLNWVDIKEQKPETNRLCLVAAEGLLVTEIVYLVYYADKPLWMEKIGTTSFRQDFTHWCYADNLKIVPYVE